ncbi:MAG TPA: WG repeat-containing protein [Bacteroidia bacterium]|nr:WG repeat-containing protein [Bacteroidia bacterium]
MQLIRISISLACLVCLSISLSAQPFEYDERGIVKDSAFHSLIKTKGYQVVGTFDTTEEYPFKIRAKVLHDGTWKEINTYGEIAGENDDYFSDDYFGDAVPEMSYDHDRYWGSKSELTTACSYEIITEGNKYGTKNNETSKRGLKIIYEGIEILAGCLATIKQKGKYGLANVDGTILFKPMYDSITLFDRNRDFSEPFFLFLYNKKWGLLDKNGRELIPAEYQSIHSCGDYSRNRNFFRVVNNNKSGLVNSNNKVIIPLKYKYIKPFSGRNGWFEADKGSFHSTYTWLYDSTGKVILDSCIAVNLTKSYHIWFAKEKEEQGLMDTSGKILLQPVYQEIFDMDKSGLVIVVKDKKWGLINLEEKFLIEPLFYGLALMRSDSLVLAANMDKNCGVLNLKGDTVIPFVYTSIKPQDSVFFYEKYGKYGRMDKKGKVLKEYDFDKMDVKYSYNYDKMAAENAFFLVKKGHFEGITDLYGNILIPVKYHRIDWKEFGETGLARAQINYTTYWVDCYGNEYLTKP